RAFLPDEFATKFIVLYDDDVLRNGDNLVEQAWKLGFISKADFEGCRVNSAGDFDDRKSLLNHSIGWFGLDNCFEQVTAKEGYLDVMIQVLEDQNQKDAFDAYLHREGFIESSAEALV